jgi:soluble epoxide hydrolase / lipid-phosphate phosphatase
MITASNDSVLKPSMAAGMGKYFDNLTTREAVAGHWALWEAASDVNNILTEWFKDQVFKSMSSL